MTRRADKLLTAELLPAIATTSRTGQRHRTMLTRAELWITEIIGVLAGGSSATRVCVWQDRAQAPNPGGWQRRTTVATTRSSTPSGTTVWTRLRWPFSLDWPRRKRWISSRVPDTAHWWNRPGSTPSLG